MKYYKYKRSLSIIFGIIGLLWFISFVFQLFTHNYMAAILYLLCTIISFVNVFIYKRPYLELGDGKIFISNGVFKKEILKKDITGYEENEKWLTLKYNKGSDLKKKKILISNLDYNDKKLFIKDFRKLLKS